MRIDKYLKISRLIKRRTVAKEACDQGRVSINENVVKAGAEVSVGDIVTLEFGTKEVKIRVLDIKEHVKKEMAKDMFEIIEG